MSVNQAFYPGSKHTYTDPLSQAETGSSNVDISTKTVIEDKEIDDAVKGIINKSINFSRRPRP
jgi:hypothetical protein